MGSDHFQYIIISNACVCGGGFKLVLHQEIKFILDIMLKQHIDCFFLVNKMYLK